MLKIIKNPDEDYFNKVSKLVEERNGYCPCALFETEETKCICANFRNQEYEGYCHCKRYLKVEDK